MCEWARKRSDLCPGHWLSTSFRLWPPPLIYPKSAIYLGPNNSRTTQWTFVSTLSRADKSWSLGQNDNMANEDQRRRELSRQESESSHLLAELIRTCRCLHLWLQLSLIAAQTSMMMSWLGRRGCRHVAGEPLTNCHWFLLKWRRFCLPCLLPH